MVWLSGATASDARLAACSENSRKCFQVDASQTFRLVSPIGLCQNLEWAVMRSFPSAEKATHLAPRPSLRSSRSTWPLATSHTRITWLFGHTVAKRVPSGEKATTRALLGLLSLRANFPVRASQRRI